ncbi:hypothetical protein ACWEKM_13200 [Streptomyces sp. NPDC004752]
MDDIAFKRSRVYGSILVDCETGAPVDLLEGREADAFARRLAQRESIEAICRDRLGARDAPGDRDDVDGAVTGGRGQGR